MIDAREIFCLFRRVSYFIFFASHFLLSDVYCNCNLQIIFPGSCCPSLHALVDAAYQGSCLTLEHIDNIGLHYAQTLAEWRRRFNAKEAFVRTLGFDDVFLRAWNYYLTYCESGFFSQTENCLILVFSRQGCSALTPLCETRSVTQPLALTAAEVNDWLV
jgi:hypothetical protein